MNLGFSGFVERDLEAISLTHGLVLNKSFLSLSFSPPLFFSPSLPPLHTIKLLFDAHNIDLEYGILQP